MYITSAVLFVVFITDVTVSSSHTHFYFPSVCCIFLTVWHLKEMWYYVYKNIITHLYGFPGLILKFGERLNREVSPYVSAPSILCLPPWLKYLTQYHIFNYPQLIFPMRIINP